MLARIVAVLITAGLGVTAAQTAPAPDTEPPVVFTSGVELVMIPVVVRDREGRTVGGLRQEDFEIYDRGKLQTISVFSTVEHQEVPTARGGSRAAAPSRPAALTSAAPQRYVAYLMDDLHLEAGDLIRVREAARRHLRGLDATDYVAVYFTSGVNMLDFTRDLGAIERALLSLMPRSMTTGSAFECPDIGYYQADLIRNRRDSAATQAAIQELKICAPGLVSSGGARGSRFGPPASTPQQDDQLTQRVVMAASRVLLMGNRQTEIAMETLQNVVDRMASLQGTRSIVFASPGFLTPEQSRQKNNLFERAIRAEVVVNSLDARGLYTDPGVDISKHVIDSSVAAIKASFASAASRAQTSVLAEVAHGTGGVFFENNNDLDEGFRRVGIPEYMYQIGFNPDKLKRDNSFHALKVKLKDGRGLSVQAREGYYAVKEK